MPYTFTPSQVLRFIITTASLALIPLEAAAYRLVYTSKMVRLSDTLIEITQEERNLSCDGSYEVVPLSELTYTISAVNTFGYREDNYYLRGYFSPDYVPEVTGYEFTKTYQAPAWSGTDTFVFEVTLTGECYPLYVLSVGLDYDQADEDDTLKSGYIATKFKEVFEWNPAYETLVSSQVLSLNPLLPAQKNRDLINEALAGLVEVMEEESILIMFISGHGGTNGTVGTEPPVMIQKDPNDLNKRVSDTGDEGLLLLNPALYTDDDLVAQFTQNPKWDKIHKVFIVDACYAGGFWPDLKVLPRTLFYGASREPDFSVATPDLVASFDFGKIVYTGTFARAVVSAFSQLEEFKGMKDFATIQKSIEAEHRQFEGNIGRIQSIPYYTFPNIEVAVQDSLMFRYTNDVRVESSPDLEARTSSEPGQVILNWAVDWPLQQSPDLIQWQDVPDAVPPLVVPVPEEDTFYRLLQPQE
jgi:hypothetical protein